MTKPLARSAVILVALGSLAFAGKEATVVTETGKTHQVNFLRMSNDTIYLLVHKPGGAGFTISGHKSRFKSVQFKDGAYFDFSWSNYDPDTRRAGIGAPLPPSEPGPDVAANTTPPPARETQSPADTAAAHAAITSPAPVPPPEATPAAPALRPETTTTAPIAPASSTPDINAPRWHAEDAQAVKTPHPCRLTVESKPSGATVFLNGSTVPGKTPLHLRQLAPGAYSVRAVQGSLSASKNVQLAPGAKMRVKLKIGGEESTESPEPVKKKYRGTGIALTVVSVGALAAAGTEFFLAAQDQKWADEAKTNLESMTVQGQPGSPYQNELDHYNAKTNAAKLETTVGSILAGVGLIGLVFGITLTF